MKPLVALSACCLIVFFAPARAADKEKTDEDKLASEVYAKFRDAFNKGNLNDVMSCTDVPYVWYQVKVIKDRDELRKKWAEFLASPDRLKPPGAGASKVLKYSKLLEAAKTDAAKGDDADKNFQEFAKKVAGLGLGKEDRVIHDLLFLSIVRIRNGEAKIVGFYVLPFRFQGKLW